MRYGVWAVAGLCALCASAPANAQSTSFASILGPPPSAIVQKPLDMSNVIAPAPALAAQQNRFSFAALFNKLSIPGFPTRQGVSPFPAPSTFPSYPDFKLVGKPPYQLGDPKAAKSRFQPPVPLVPNTKTPVGPGSN